MALDRVSTHCSTIFGALSGKNPNPMQSEVWDYLTGNDYGAGLLLKAPTGSGKTEAVCLPALALQRRLILVYPTRSLVDDQISRLSELLKAASQQTPGHCWTMVIDMGAQSLRQGWRNGEEIKFTDNPRRHLYRGDVIITTLDKFIYRFFGFGEPGKSYIYPLRIHYGAQQTLICFDEAHTYDDVSFTNFKRLVQALYDKGLDVVLMTATMPPAFAAEFGFLDEIDYIADAPRQNALERWTQQQFPQRCHPHKHLTYLPIPSQPAPDGGPSLAVQEIARRAQAAAAGQRIIVTAERVDDAIWLFETLREAYPDALLYHGRLTVEQRKQAYTRLQQIEQQHGSYLLVSTSAIEVGCDLDAHTLITQLCDPERLIQRAGRCNRRREAPNAQVIVVGDRPLEWETGMPPADQMRYTKELERQSGSFLDTLTLKECICKTPNPDERIEVMFDMLYEYVYEARLENKGLHDRGLVITRSWEPTLTLCTSYDDQGHIENAIEVPMSQCVARGEEIYLSYAEVFRAGFDWQEHKPSKQSLDRWGCAYLTNVIVVLQDGSFDETVGYRKVPYVFNRSFPSGYRRVLERADGHDKALLWYIDPRAGQIQALTQVAAAVEDDSDGGEDAD